MTDRIELRAWWSAAITAFSTTKRDGQDFIVDVVLWLDLRAAAVSDDLADTVDYGRWHSLRTTSWPGNRAI